MKRTNTANTGFALGWVTCKLGALSFYSSSVQVNRFVLRNQPKRKAKKSYHPFLKNRPPIKKMNKNGLDIQTLSSKRTNFQTDPVLLFSQMTEKKGKYLSSDFLKFLLAGPQLVHMVLSDTQANPSQNPKSHFLYQRSDKNNKFTSLTRHGKNKCKENNLEN